MANRMTTHSSSIARTPSPVGSESSDFYYNDPVFESAYTSPTVQRLHITRTLGRVEAMSAMPATPPHPPARPCDVHCLHRRTLNGRAPRHPSPRCVACKVRQGWQEEQRQKRAAIAPTRMTPSSRTLALAVAASLGQTTVLNHACESASSSRRLPESPSKRIRTSPGDDTAPAAHQGTSADSPFLIPTMTTATSTAGRPDNVVASAPPPSPHLAPLPQPPLPTLAAADATTPTTFAAVVAVPAPTAAAHATLAAVWRRQPQYGAPGPSPKRLANTAEAARGPRLADRGQTHPAAPSPHPPGGFPTVVYSSVLLTQGMPPGLMQLYNEVRGPKFFVVISGGNRATNPDSRPDPHRPRIRPQPCALAGRRPVPTPSAGHPGPAVLSSPPHHIVHIPFDMPVIGFVGTFSGFTLPNTQRTDRERGVTFSKWPFERTATSMNSYEPIATLSQLVAVEGMELLVNNTITVAWQLSVTPPTNDHGAWLQLRRLFGRLSVMTASTGQRLQRSYRCHIARPPTTLLAFAHSPASQVGLAHAEHHHGVAAEASARRLRRPRSSYGATLHLARTATPIALAAPVAVERQHQQV
ncbi:hypothetical protein B0H14DRAFT_3540828 [Mycena olivaceomarginata]|nr:hypothetical protein B0H14DRAFT_3540828 [Mycena olivaceomarginata]